MCPTQGHVEAGETEMDAAKRETEEEAGLKPHQYNIIEDFKRTLRYKVRRGMKRVEYWLAQLTDLDAEVKISHEHKGFKWLTLDQALIYAPKSNQQQVCKEAQQFIESSL